jgi:spore coat polysaccharide biosynthesis protein SpsF
MKTVVLIAVRMKSKRLPKKAMVEIEGKPLIEHLIERLKTAKTPQSVILCTSTSSEDGVLVSIAKKTDTQWFRGSPDDVLERFIQAAEVEGADIVVRATGDNPLTDPVYLDRAVAHHINTGAEYTYVDGLPKGTECEVMSLVALKKCWETAHNPGLSEYMTLYFKDSGLFKTERVEADEDVRRPHYRLTVDSPEDLKLVKEIYKKLYKKKGIFPLQEVVKLMDENPKLMMINAHLKPKKVKMHFVNGKMRIIEVEGESDKS